MLLRFSALTFNAHRIHYDRGCAREVGGYPGLAVHGPLSAVLLAQLVQQSTSRPMRTFQLPGRGATVRPGAVAAGRHAGRLNVALQAQGPDGKAALLATATLG